MKIRSGLVLLLTCVLAAVGSAGAREIELPAQSVVYLRTSEDLVGKKDQVAVGQMVRCTVWRDVTRHGHVIIAAGTPALAKVDSFKTRKVAGIKGKLTLAALETEGVDGNAVTLTGGYNKEGKGRIAMAASLAALVAWPTIFITGDAARLPAGTVFDAYTTHRVTVDIPGAAAPVPRIDLSALGGFSAELLYEELAEEKKPKVFPLRLTAPEGAAGFVVDRINGMPIEPIPLEIGSVTASDEGQTVLASVRIKPLAKEFAKGLNTIEIAYTEADKRVGTELLVEIQF